MIAGNLLIVKIRSVVFCFTTVVFIIGASAQIPDSDFSLPSSACLGENLNITNNSTNAISYQWEFCQSDPSGNVQINSTGILNDGSTTMEIELINSDDLWYGFITSRDNSRLFRLDFGDDLDNDYSITQVNITGDPLSQPYDIEIIKNQNVWYGLVSNGNNNITILNFGNSLTNNPSGSNYGGLGLSLPRGMQVVDFNGDIVAVVSNFSSPAITTINFGSDLSSPVITNQSVPVTDGLGLMGISLINDGSNWIASVTSFSNNKLFQLDFGTDLMNTNPTLSDLTTTVGNLNSPTETFFIQQGNNYYNFVSNRNTGLIRLDYGNTIDSDPSSDFIGNAGASNYSNILAFEVAKQGPDWIGFSLSFSAKEIFKIDFSKVCDPGVEDVDLTLKNPANVHYTEAGEKHIKLIAIASNGDTSTSFGSVIINGIQAPDIDFLTSNACLTNVNNFSGLNNTPSQTITTWTWDFGDGSPTDTGQNTTHQYTGSGTYGVILQAESDNTCNQIAFQEITIFEEPVPDFTVPAGLKCSNQALLFSNTTPGDYGDAISWTWDFGDGGNSTAKDPEHSFAAAGTYNVKLTASIPGCTTETTISVDVSEGPMVDYSFANECLNNSITFTNNTTGTGIISYTWDFGDGITSNLVNPTHTFADPGDYNVMLTVDNDIGCSVTNTQTVTVYALPEVAFINELACSNGGTQFFDESTAAGANITGWEWDFGDGHFSTEEDPIHMYQTSGSFPVSLRATTNFGCSATLEKAVDVIVGPTVDFTVDQVCLGEETQFEGLSESSDGSAITSWFWEIDGQVFTGQNPTTNFTSSGTYQVSLTVTSSTFCTATITKDVVINPLPAADFSVVNACVNDVVQFNDESVATGDAIATYDWSFSNLGNSSDANPVFTFEETGNYNVSLTITTVTGCVSTVSKTISILDRPQGAFTTDVSQGPPPLTVNFQNNSAGADNYRWDFGNGESSTVTNPIFTFTDIGVFEVTMVASTDDGCTDTIRQSINIVEPLMDLALKGMTTLLQDGKTRVSLDIRNNGTLFIDRVEVVLEIGSEASVTETVERTIAPGELLIYPLSISINNRTTTPYLCATLTSLQPAFAEENPANNIFCINLNEKSNVIDPFPNPSDRLVTVGVVLQESQKVIITMHNAMGQPVLERKIQDAPEGLNEFKVDVSGISDGIYWLKLRYGTSEEAFRVFVEK